MFVEVQDGGRFVVKLVEIDGNKADLSKKRSGRSGCGRFGESPIFGWTG